jgi:alpha-galactosidase/6-phospho-beta-glucosidase family protein
LGRIERDRLWKLDWEIPLKHGALLRQEMPARWEPYLVTVPLVLEVSVMEIICPDAWVLNQLILKAE